MRDFIKSDHCPECGGSGFRIEKDSHDPYFPGQRIVEYEQCEECEKRHADAQDLLDELRTDPRKEDYERE